MVRRTSRSDAYVDKPKLLEALATCRKTVIVEKDRMKVGGALYYSSATVIAAIDGLGLMLTGSEHFFYDPFGYRPVKKDE